MREGVQNWVRDLGGKKSVVIEMIWVLGVIGMIGVYTYDFFLR